MRSTEKKSTSSQKQEKQTHTSSRPKGQQRGGKGHGRKTVTTLPVVPETLDLEEQQKHCPECGLLFKDLGTEDSDVIEVEVQAHIRRYHMVKWRDEELSRPKLKEQCRKVLTSLQNHWEGLSLFADYPEVPMDNNAAERSLRSPVVGWKNYYGTGSDWSGELTAWLFSVFMTLNLWDINPWFWLSEYLQACAENERKPPIDMTGWLPWLMRDERLQLLRNHSPPDELQVFPPQQ